jgi:hypothetical protein
MSVQELASKIEKITVSKNVSIEEALQSMIGSKFDYGHLDSLKYIHDTLTPTGNHEADKARANEFAKSVNMDEANTKVVEVMATQGQDAAMEHMLTDQKTGQQLSYAESRRLYG